MLLKNSVITLPKIKETTSKSGNITKQKEESLHLHLCYCHRLGTQAARKSLHELQHIFLALTSGIQCPVSYQRRFTRRRTNVRLFSFQFHLYSACYELETGSFLSLSSNISTFLTFSFSSAWIPKPAANHEVIIRSEFQLGFTLYLSVCMCLTFLLTLVTCHIIALQCWISSLITEEPRTSLLPS